MTDLDKLKACYSEIGIDFYTRSITKEFGTYVYVFLGNLGDHEKEYSTERLIKRRNFIEFEDGKLASY